MLGVREKESVTVAMPEEMLFQSTLQGLGMNSCVYRVMA